MIVDKSSEEVDMKQLPPQPTPEEFGYDPSGNKPAPNTGQQPTTPQAGPQ
jgi:hypothetical protein